MTAPNTQCGSCGADMRPDRAICRQCADRAAENLKELYWHEVRDGRVSDNLLDELATTATRQARLTDPLGVRGGAETPLVFHAQAVAHLRALGAFLRREAERWHVYAPGHDNPQSHAARLFYVMPDIVPSPDAVAFVDELQRLVREARAIVDHPPDMWFAGPCPVCEADLYATEGAAVVRCGVCRSTADVAVQRERLLAAVDDVLATAGEISRAVHITGVEVTPSKITNLFHRGKLVRHGRNRTGDHLYRMGDVLMVIRSQARSR